MPTRKMLRMRKNHVPKNHIKLGICIAHKTCLACKCVMQSVNHYTEENGSYYDVKVTLTLTLMHEYEDNM